MRLGVADVRNDIFTTAEITAAYKMHLIITVFQPCLTAYFSCYSLGGSKKVMPGKKFLFLAVMIRSLGPQLTWKVMLIQHQPYQIELPINPELRLHLNDMTDQECRLHFRFRHRHIQLLVSRLGFPDVIIIPEHKDRVLAVEAFCLLLH